MSNDSKNNKIKIINGIKYCLELPELLELPVYKE